MKLVFFGSSEFSVYVLEELKLQNFLPSLIITTPDKPQGRKLILTPNVVKIWAEKNNIKFLNPISLKKENSEIVSNLKSCDPDIFLVASYGKIIPKEIFEIPKFKTLNIHPSLLPKYRGASPIQAQILNTEKEIGVTIMQINEEMDKGEIIIQKITHQNLISTSLTLKEIPNRKELEKNLAIEGAKLFTQILPDWLAHKIKPITQDENKATYCQKIIKEDGELQIDLKNLPTGKEAEKNLAKIKAFEDWPTTYFYTERNGKKIRVIITQAVLENDKLKILRVIPEGKKEMLYEDFLRGVKGHL